MGPHGNNNKEIFDIIESTGLKIDKNKFTYYRLYADKVINYLSREYYKIRILRHLIKLSGKILINLLVIGKILLSIINTIKDLLIN